MTHALDEDFRAGLFDEPDPPCLSVYQPTHRHFPDNRQDPIRYGNLLKTLERSLREQYPGNECEPLLEPLRALAEDPDFWNCALDGLAVLRSAGLFRAYRLQRPVPELAVAADSFHVKPLIRILQSADRYQVLGINRNEVKLFEGNRDALDPIELAPGVPRTMTDALGTEVTEPQRKVASYGGVGTGHRAVQHGHGDRRAEIDKDAERYFRAVDRALTEQHSGPGKLPLILAALPEHHHMFRKVSHNPYLLPDAVGVHPDAISADELRRRAWQLIEPRYLARLASLVEDFGGARAAGRGSSDLETLGKAALEGRVATLLVEAGRVIPGRIDPAGGELTQDELLRPDVDDVLDDLAELTLKMGGDVVVVPGERMPTTTGAAAIYRY